MPIKRKITLKKKGNKMSNNTIRLEGLTLYLYLIKRFEYSPSKALEVMKERNQDLSFLDLTIKQAIKELS